MKLLVPFAALSLLCLACDASDDAAPSSHPNRRRSEAGSSAPEARSSAAGAAARDQQPSAAKPPVQSAADAFGADADVVTWSTEPFKLDAGQERYVCFAKTLEEDLVVNGYSAKGEKFVHHVIFARANRPEPEGISECDVAFRSSWETLFISGTGVNTLEFPDDAGHVLKKGTQLVAQLHVLNVTDAPVEGSHTIHMRRSPVASPRPVTSVIFGTAAVKLPAQQTSQVVGTCPARGAVKLIAGFPHMHMLGSSLRFEVGPNANALEEVFARDPFDFDNQRIDKLELDISPGQVTRVTCTFNNTTDQEVGYGESTRNEMCYFVGFAVDTRGGTCIEVLPPNIFGR